MRRKNQGITLIALIITVIVLIILAGVTISMVVGDDGIITKSKEAKQNMSNATAEEEELLKNMLNAMNEIESNSTGEMTLVDMFKKAEADECMNLDGACNREDHLHIGDYVNYQNPTSGTYTITAEKSGEDYDQVYDIANNQLNWRVLGIDEETGGLKLITGSPMKLNDIPEWTNKKDPYLYLYGAEAYVYGPEEMDKACEMYKNEYANKARSVNMEDINQVLKIEGADDIKTNNVMAMQGLIQYGEKYGPYENQYTPESWLNGKTATTVEGTVDAYAFSIGEEEGMLKMENTRAKSMLFDNIELGKGRAYWLASRGVFARSGEEFAHFGPGCVFENVGVVGAAIGHGMFYSDDGENENWLAVCPVVSLKSEITKNEISRIADKVEENWNYNAGPQ